MEGGKKYLASPGVEDPAAQTSTCSLCLKPWGEGEEEEAGGVGRGREGREEGKDERKDSRKESRDYPLKIKV